MIETITALLTTPPKILLLSMYVWIVFGVIFSRKRERLLPRTGCTLVRYWQNQAQYSEWRFRKQSDWHRKREAELTSKKDKELAIRERRISFLRSQLRLMH